MALFYNTDGTVSNVEINAIIYGKVTSSLATTPTIQQAFEASASNAAAQTANPTRTNRTNTGSLYVKSGATIQKTYSGNSYSVLNPNDPNANKGDANYWMTASFTIPNYFISASIVQIVTSSLGLGPVNTSAKVAIPTYIFDTKFGSPILSSSYLSKISIIAYNGIKSFIAGFNEISSSNEIITVASSSIESEGRTITRAEYSYPITSSFVVMYISASKANMGQIKSNDLVINLGTIQAKSISFDRDRNPVSESMAFAQRYPNDPNIFKGDANYWVIINGTASLNPATVERDRNPISETAAFAQRYPNDPNIFKGDYTYLSSIAPDRDRNPVSEKAAFEAKYPTDKSDWSLINGVLTSPKNQ